MKRKLVTLATAALLAAIAVASLLPFSRIDTRYGVRLYVGPAQLTYYTSDDNAPYAQMGVAVSWQGEYCAGVELVGDPGVFTDCE